MKKSLSTILVILLSMIGFKSLAAELDMNVNKVVKETSDSTGDKNEGARRCGSQKGR